MEIIIRKLFISLVILSTLTSEGASIPSSWWYAVLPGNEQVGNSDVIRRDTGEAPAGTLKAKRAFFAIARKVEPGGNRSWPGDGSSLGIAFSYGLDSRPDYRFLYLAAANPAGWNRKMAVHHTDSSPPADFGSKVAEYQI